MTQYLGIPTPNSENILTYVKSTFISPLLGVSIAAILIGLYPSYRLYISRTLDYEKIISKSPTLRGIWTFLYNRWYINAIYYRIFVNGVQSLSKTIYNNLECWGGGLSIKSLYTSISNAFRKIQTGYLRMNIIYILIGLLILTLLTLLMVV